MNNITVAERLLNHAAALERKGCNLYRIRVFRKAAALVRMLSIELEELVREGGRPALEALPGIGSHLAITLEGLIKEGRLRTVGPTAEEADPQERLTSLPGVGPVTALRIMEELGIETTTEVESAVAEGRLRLVGVGYKRRRGIQAILRERREGRNRGISASCEPSIHELLSVDEEYRALVEVRRESVGTPVLTTRRGDWTFRVTLSPSPLAYRLGQQRDWVAISFRNGDVTGERIVVTEERQPYAGRRVVRGRERECQACWAS